MNKKLAAAVVARARNRCEYCLYPQSDSVSTFHFEHCIPKAHGGRTSLENLAWSCPFCNGNKLSYTHALDNVTHQVVRLFNPRIDLWGDHFIWSPNGIQLIGVTPVGRATIQRLKMNGGRWPTVRSAMILRGDHPLQIA